tara:strand:- start:2370 stop:3647 length:1278 start_codon:yes stop_codon:yes gene_type:complete
MQGYTRKEAARLTKNALYDWKHALSEAEAKYWVAVIPFYRYYRLSMQQGLTALTEPLTYPSKAFQDAILGKSKLKRWHQQYALRETMPLLWDPGVGSDYKTTAQQMHELSPMLMSHYTRRNPQLRVWENDEIERNHYFRTKGYAAEASGYLVPPMTALDSFDMMMSWGKMMAGGILKSTGNEKYLAPDWEEQGIETTLDIMMPQYKFMIQQMLKNAEGLDVGGSYRGAKMTLNPAEKAVYDIFGMEVIHDDKGRPTADTIPLTVFRITPVALELMGPSGLLNSAYFDNPYAKRAFETHDGGDVAKGLKHFLGVFSGIAKPVPIDTRYQDIGEWGVPTGPQKFHFYSQQSGARQVLQERGVDVGTRETGAYPEYTKGNWEKIKRLEHGYSQQQMQIQALQRELDGYITEEEVDKEWEDKDIDYSYE